MKRRSLLPVALAALLVSHAMWAFSQEVKRIQYEYTIEVRSVGPAAAKPATVELKWPKGTDRFSPQPVRRRMPK